ncbi:TPA: fimbrillin family protein, partial [Elizabethkingia anophelis]|nr:fimbrillin family protein [Elizabethkingia anophelis]
DYTIGQAASPMMLDGGVPYNIVVYSYGANTLPPISANEQFNISSSTVNYDDTNRDFMYQKINYTPDGNKSNNILNITLQHKISQINAIVNAGSLGNIENITGGMLTPHYSNGAFSLSSGVMSGRTSLSAGVGLNFSGLNTMTVKSNPVFINSDTSGGKIGRFSAEITIGGVTKTISLPNSFKISPGNKSDLNINLMKCGAYIGPNNDRANYKEFMCHNLGADTSADPFTPAAAIYGAKYQWGAQTNEAGRYYSQSDDQSNSNTIIGWNSTPKADGSWSDTTKTVNDPCPPGYRVPTTAQWQSVINNNNVERVGSWVDSVSNYGTVLYFVNPSNIRTLMLPAAGYRDFRDGLLYSRGSIGRYLSSSSTVGNNLTSRILTFNNRALTQTDYPRTTSFPVRCISE